MAKAMWVAAHLILLWPLHKQRLVQPTLCGCFRNFWCHGFAVFLIGTGIGMFASVWQCFADREWDLLAPLCMWAVRRGVVHCSSIARYSIGSGGEGAVIKVTYKHGCCLKMLDVLLLLVPLLLFGQGAGGPARLVGYLVSVHPMPSARSCVGPNCWLRSVVR